MSPKAPATATNPAVALVTGGSRGIGRAVVEALLDLGHRLFFCGRDPDSLARAERELLARFPGRVAARRCDVRDERQVAELFAWVEREAGRLDVLVNNAGIGGFAPVDELEPERFREIVETNLHGAFYGMHHAARVMKRQGGGFIFNIASLAAKNPLAGGAAYNASKFGLVGMSEAAMLDLRHHGIRVAAICPGSVETDFGAGRMKDGESWRLQPEDVARAVVDLLAFPARALPSLIELRPSRPPKR